MVFGQAGGASKQSVIKAFANATAVLPAGIDSDEGSGVERKAWLMPCLTLNPS